MTPADRPDDRDGSPLERLVALLEMLAELDDADRRRDRHADDTTVDISIGVSTIDDLLDAEPTGRSGRPDDRREASIEPEQEVESDPAPHVDVRERADGVTVVADLPDVEEDAVSVDIDRDAGELGIAVHGDEVGRVPLEGDDYTITGASFTNQVLAVELERSDTDQ